MSGGLLRRATLFSVVLLSMPALAEKITATLKLKGRVTMQQLADSVQNPTSAHYKRFYEPSEIRALTAPGDAQYNDLISGLKQEGMSVLHESPTHLWVTVRGERAIFESLFATKIQSVGNGRHMAMSQTRVPFHLNLIESVSGLDSTRSSKPRMLNANHLNALRGSHGGSAQGHGGIAPAVVKTAYGLDPIYAQGLTGKGVHIAIATYNGFKVDEVNSYYVQNNISPAPQVDQVSFNGDAAYDEQSAGETQLDAEFSGMIAPGAQIHVFASATNDDGGELAMFTAILDDNRAKIVNYSWGGCEASTTAQHRTDMDAVFSRAVAQGVNILVATGDSGSDSCATGTAAADWPAANPNIVAVGGTSMTFDGTTMSETGWNGSGGGISAIFALPSWQQMLTAPFAMRSYPDVSFNADPNTGEAIYAGGQWQVVGGTSMAAPQWAGYLALVAESRANQGKADVGFLNPIIYGMSASDRASTLNDVTSGNNGAYSCNAGWDAVTGYGSMQGSALQTYLQNL